MITWYHSRNAKTFTTSTPMLSNPHTNIIAYIDAYTHRYAYFHLYTYQFMTYDYYPSFTNRKSIHVVYILSFLTNIV
jgi:hypothetical protein